MELKKLLRTILSVVMAAALVFGSVAMLAGCKGADNNGDSNDKNNAAQYEGLEKEEYLQKLGENNLGAVIDSVGEVYGGILGGLGESNAMDQTGGAKVNMTLTVGDPLMDLLEQAIFAGEAPVDISFLQEINLDMDVGMKDQMQAIQMALGLKGQHIITANLLMNMADSVMHIGLPELNDQWLKLEAGETVPGAITDGASSTAMLAELAKALPDAEVLTKVLDRYLALVLAELDNVDQSTEKLELYGLEQECTVLTLKIYEKDAMDIAKAVLKAAKDDGDLKKIIEDVAKAVEEMAGQDIGAEDAYTDFKEAVTDLLADLEEETEFDTESFIQLDTYVDKNHNVIGMKLSMPGYGDRGMVYYYSVTEGEKFAVEFAIPNDTQNSGEDDFKFGGTGTKKDGKTSGTYTVSVEDMEILTVKVEDLTEETGTITLTPDKDVISGIVGGEVEMLADLSLQIKLTGDGFELNVLGDNQLLLGIALKAAESNGPALSEPSNAVDVTDSSAMEKWAEKLVLDKVMDNLEKAGAADFIELLESAVKAPAEDMSQPNPNWSDESWN